MAIACSHAVIAVHNLPFTSTFFVSNKVLAVLVDGIIGEMQTHFFLLLVITEHKVSNERHSHKDIRVQVSVLKRHV